jgi:hypothetical protein
MLCDASQMRSKITQKKCKQRDEGCKQRYAYVEMRVRERCKQRDASREIREMQAERRERCKQRDANRDARGMQAERYQQRDERDASREMQIETRGTRGMQEMQASRGMPAERFNRRHARQEQAKRCKQGGASRRQALSKQRDAHRGASRGIQAEGQDASRRATSRFKQDAKVACSDQAEGAEV